MMMVMRMVKKMMMVGLMMIMIMMLMMVMVMMIVMVGMMMTMMVAGCDSDAVGFSEGEGEDNVVCAMKKEDV